MAELQSIAEGQKFAVTSRLEIGAGKDDGSCQVALIPNHSYTVIQNIPHLIVAEGVCHVKQNNRFATIDKEIVISFAIEPNGMQVVKL